MHALAPGMLARFQDTFAQALREPAAAPAAELTALTAQPAFAVYRNTVMKGCIDALQANYPAVTRIVGEEWFRAAAAVYVRETPPSNPTLLNYGADFADFLGRFDPAADLPYLPGVARLDRFWTEAHAAPSQPALDPTDLAGLAPEALATTTLRPHPAVRWAWFSEGPIFTIWSRNRAEGAYDPDIEWRPEGALLVRPRDTVRWIALDAAGCAFLDACAAGRTLAGAAQAALEAQANADLAQLMSSLIEAGAFRDMGCDDPSVA